MSSALPVDAVRRFLAVLVLFLAIVSLLVVGAPAVNASSSADEPGVSDAQGQPTPLSEGAALGLAAVTGEPQRVDTLTTETQVVTADPERGLVAEVTAFPVRVKRPDLPEADRAGWVPVNADLEVNSESGRLVPRAARVDLSITADGTDALARLRGDDGESLVVDWPSEYGQLPAPSVEGDLVRFAGVWPEVDLVLWATSEGFATHLVVYTPEAAGLPQVGDFGLELTATGLTLSTDAKGRFQAKNAGGDLVFASQLSYAWDAGDEGLDATAIDELVTKPSTRAASPTSGDIPDPIRDLVEMPEGARAARVAVTLEQGAAGATKATARADAAVTRARLRVRVDKGFLAGPGSWPRVIDPSFETGDIQDVWAMVWSNGDDWYGVSSGLEPSVGYEPTQPKRARSFFRFNIETFVGASSIESAEFKHKQVHSPQHSCGGSGPPAVEVWRMEDWGSGISWSNQPAKMGRQSADSLLRGHRDRCPNDIYQKWNVKPGLVNALNNGEIRYNLGMFSADEYDSLGWRKYVGPQAAMPSLKVIYNHTPNKPGAINMYDSDGSQSPWSVDRWWVSNGRPQLRANATDPNNGDVIYYQFHVWRSDGWEGTFKSSANVVEGTSGVYQPPEDKAFANGNYHWQARACDSDICGPWSSNGMFYVGHVTPNPGSAKTMNENGSSPLMVEGKPWFNVGARPKVSVVADDYDDHGPLTVEFQALNAADSVIASGTVSNVAVGGTAAWTLPAMTSAGTFGWRARAKDKMGFYSRWMAGQDFVINRLPSKPYGRHVWNDTGIAGVQYQSKDYVRTRYPILQAAPVDPDGNSVRARFRIKQQGATTYLHDWTSSAYASGSTISWVVPGLPQGTYVWEVAGVDVSGATSEFNVAAPLVVDLTAPSAPTITDAPHVAAFGGKVEIGVDSTSNDVRFYRYGFQTSTTPQSTPELATLGAATTLTRSGHFGPDAVTVAAQDIAGNVSGTAAFSFKVMGASSAHHWRLDDLSDLAEPGGAGGDGVPLALRGAADLVAGGHAATYDPFASGEGQAWVAEDKALRADTNGAGYAETTGSNANVLDASQGFSISTWVKLDADATSDNYVATSLPLGDSAIAELGYLGTNGGSEDRTWRFALDTTAGRKEAQADPTAIGDVAGEWVHLTAVYEPDVAVDNTDPGVDDVPDETGDVCTPDPNETGDGGAEVPADAPDPAGGGTQEGTLRLYVNGVEQGSTSFTGSADQDVCTLAPVRIGAGQSAGTATDAFDGLIDEVRIFTGPLDPVAAAVVAAEIRNHD